VSTKTSAAAINNPVDIRVSGSPFRTGCGPRTNRQKRIIWQNTVGRGCQRLKARGGLAPVREQHPFALCDAAQNGLRVLTELEHGDCFHTI